MIDDEGKAIYNYGPSITPCTLIENLQSNTNYTIHIAIWDDPGVGDVHVTTAKFGKQLGINLPKISCCIVTIAHFVST